MNRSRGEGRSFLHQEVQRLTDLLAAARVDPSRRSPAVSLRMALAEAREENARLRRAVWVSRTRREALRGQLGRLRANGQRLSRRLCEESTELGKALRRSRRHKAAIRSLSRDNARLRKAVRKGQKRKAALETELAEVRASRAVLSKWLYGRRARATATFPQSFEVAPVVAAFDSAAHALPVRVRRRCGLIDQGNHCDRSGGARPPLAAQTLRNSDRDPRTGARPGAGVPAFAARPSGISEVSTRIVEIDVEAEQAIARSAAGATCAGEVVVRWGPGGCPSNTLSAGSRWFPNTPYAEARCGRGCLVRAPSCVPLGRG